MAFPSVTNTFVNGQSADATEVNTNFTDIINGFSDGTKDLNMNAGTLAGALTCNGAVTLGNGTGDDLTFTGSLASTLNIKTDGSYDIGSATLGLRLLYFGDSGGNTIGIQAPSIASNFTLTLPGYTSVMPTSDGVNRDYLQTDGSGNMSWVPAPTVTEKDNTYTAVTGDKIINIDTNANGAWTLGLYTAVGNKDRELIFYKTTTDTNACTLDPNSTETFGTDARSTIKLATEGDYLHVKSNGANWDVLQENINYLATYSTNAGQSINTSTTTIVDFEDVISDNQSLVTTGGSWAYTSPKDGVATVSGLINYGAYSWTASNNISVYIYSAGSIVFSDEYASGVNATNQKLVRRFSFSFRVSKSDAINVRTWQNSGGSRTLDSNGNINRISVNILN